MEAASTESSPWATPQDESPADANATAEQDPFARRPEVFVGAAFAGGLAIAGLLRWLGRDE